MDMEPDFPKSHLDGPRPTHPLNNNEARQQAYYSRTAQDYDTAHLELDEEHNIAASFLFGMIDYFGFTSMLDVGAGTGRLLRLAQTRCPSVRRHGIEPVGAMREIAYQNGVSRLEMTEGNARKIAFTDGEFDTVCAFGVLHHIGRPEEAISEMLRVAKRAIFISDMNCYGFGSPISRMVKQALRSVRLWSAADWLLTRGRGFRWDEGDGLWYAYSIFDSLPQIRQGCDVIYLLKTKGEGVDLFRSCSHVAVLAIKH